MIKTNKGDFLNHGGKHGAFCNNCVGHNNDVDYAVQDYNEEVRKITHPELDVKSAFVYSSRRAFKDINFDAYSPRDRPNN